MSLIRFNPVRELLNVEKEFSRLFTEMENKFGFSAKHGSEAELENAVWIPAADIYENDNQYEIRVDIPGIKKEEVSISLSKGALKISGERKTEQTEKNGKYHRVERVFGKFFRSFTLPEGINENKIDASFSEGQLKIIIPKAEEIKPKEIQIKVN